MSESILKLDNVTMQFGGVVALNDVNNSQMVPSLKNKHSEKKSKIE